MSICYYLGIRYTYYIGIKYCVTDIVLFDDFTREK